MTDYNLPPGVTTRDLPGNGPEPTEAHNEAAWARLLANVEQFTDGLAADCAGPPGSATPTYPEECPGDLTKATIPQLVSLFLGGNFNYAHGKLLRIRDEFRRRFIEANDDLLQAYIGDAMSEGDE